MFTDPMTLIGQAVDNLEMLMVFLADESDERVFDASHLTPEAENCKAAVGLCNSLLPR